MRRKFARARQRHLALALNRTAPRHSNNPARPTAGKLHRNMALAALAGIAWIAPQTVRAQTCTPSTDVSIPFHFSTKDQSVWGPGRGAYSFDYKLGKDTGVLPYGTGAKYIHLVIPALVVAGVTIVPEIDLGTWGGELSGSFSANAGLHFYAQASGGSINADVPLNLIITYPQQQVKGQNFTLTAYFKLSPDAAFTTTSPNASAKLSAYFNAAFSAYASLTLGSNKLLDHTTIFDGDKYGAIGTDKLPNFTIDTDQQNTGIDATFTPASKIFTNDEGHKEVTVFDFNAVDLINDKLKLQYEKKDEEGQLLFGGYIHLPKIETTGQVSGSTIKSSGHDWAVKVNADITNLITWGARKAGIPIPDLNFEKVLGNSDYNLDVNTHLLDLSVTGQFGFQQDFALTPRPHLRMHLVFLHDNNTTTTSDDYTTTQEIDVVGAVSQNSSTPTAITVTMPTDGKSVQVTPYLTFNNGFSSRLSLWGYTGLDFNLLQQQISATIKGHDLFDVNIQPVEPISKGIQGTIDLPHNGKGYLDFYNADKNPTSSGAYPGDSLEGFKDDSGYSESTGASFTIIQQNVTPTFAGKATPDTVNIYNYNADNADQPNSNLTVNICAVNGAYFYNNSANTQTTDFWWDYGTPHAVKLATLDGNSAYHDTNRTKASFQIDWHQLAPAGKHSISTVITPKGGQPSVYTTNFKVLYHRPDLRGLQLLQTNGVNNGSPDNLTSLPAVTQSEFDTNKGIMLSALGYYFDKQGTTIYWEPDGHPELKVPLKITSLNQDNAGDQESAQFMLTPAQLAHTGKYYLSVYNSDVDGDGGGFAQSNSQTYRLPVTIFQYQPTVTGAKKHADKVGQTGPSSFKTDSNIYTLSGPVQLDVFGLAQTTQAGGNNPGSNYCQDTVIKVVDNSTNPPTITALATEYVSPSQVRVVVPQNLLKPGFLKLRANNPVITEGNGNVHGGDSAADLNVLVYNPAPIVSSLTSTASTSNSSDSIALGSDDTIMLVNGQMFAPSAYVIIPGAGPGGDDPTFLLLHTEYVSSTQLRVTVPASIAAKVGTYTLQAINPSEFGTTSSNPPATSMTKLIVNYPTPKTNSSATTVYLSGSSPSLPITGGGFYPATKATANNANASVTYVNNKNLRITLPDNVMGKVTVAVTNPTDTVNGGGGVSNSASYMVVRDVTSQVKITRNGFVRNSDGSFSQSVVVTANKTLSGPVSLLLSNLTNGVLVNAGGKTQIATPTGTSYLSLASGMKVGQTVTVILRFNKVTAAPTYTPVVVAGATP